MNLTYVMAATFLGIAACATPGPKLPEPVAMSEDSLTHDTPDSVTSETSSATAGELEFVDIPEVAEAADVAVKDKIICSMERRTGTHRAKRVCRTASSIEKSSREGKEAFEVLRRSQVDSEL